MTRAIYPGSFDPFHNGHLDIARRAAGLFDELLVTVFDAPAKQLLFSTDERIQLAGEALEDVKNITIVSYSGLTVKWAQRHGVRVIVRGIRNVDDLSFESRIDMANRLMAPQIETCYLLCSTDYVYLSSTILKEVAGLDGDVSHWVTPHTEEALRQRFAERKQ
jgi:pantetheine-phosphate adenylyltransferase